MGFFARSVLLGAAVGATWVVAAGFPWAHRRVVRSRERMPLVVFARSLPVGAAIALGDLRLERVHPRYATFRSTSDVGDVAGAVLLCEVVEGEPVVRACLKAPGAD